MLEKLLHDDLKPGEELIWSERPIRAAHFQKRHAIATTVIVVWIAIAACMFHFFRTSDASPPLLVEIFFGGFACIGLLAQFKEVYLSRFLIYGITNRRAIILRSGPLVRTIHSFYPETVTNPLKREGKSGAGTLIFKREEQEVEWWNRGLTQVREIGFIGVRNVREVEALLLALRGSQEP